MSKLFTVLFPKYPSFQLFLALAVGMLVTIFITPLLIKSFKKRNIGQVIRTDGPEPHLSKQGTPTMGGLGIILASLIAYGLISYSRGYSMEGLLVAGMLVFCGLLGFVDDILKTARLRSLGLQARYKIAAQLIIALVFSYLAINYAFISTAIKIPFTQSSIDLGILYPILVYLIVASTTNTVNFSDGLDGLAAGTVAIVCIAFAGIAFREKMPDVAFFAAAIAGATAGFLWWNSHPAQIFMGDTGSLSLGGVIAALAILTKTELFLPLLGGIYVIEGLSVIIQIVSFRLTGKRVFKMAPIHHHFEMKGWSETQIMIRFWILTGILAAWGFALYFSGAR